MYGYVAYFNGRRHELRASSLYEAKQRAIAHFKPRKSQEHMVAVVLAERSDGTPVVHTAVD